VSSKSYVVKRALLISFFERYGITSLQLLSAVILARLLTPEDIGIYTVGVAVIGIAHMIRDFGVGQYLLQEKSLTVEKVASALGLTMTFAWILGGTLLLSAPYIALYYEEPAVEEVLFVVSLNFLIIPLGAMAPALLKRSMSFGTIFKINLTAAAVGVSVSITLAYMDFGFMSMAWATVANVAVSALMSQLYLPKKYRVMPSLSNVKPILSFGSHVVGANLIGEVSNSALELIVAKYLGFASLGFLSRGQGYIKMYSNIIEKATVPVISAHMARIHREGESINEAYSYVMNYVTLIGWFCLGFMGFMGSHIIRILYGDQWDMAVPLASLLCLIACINIPNSSGGRLLVSTGRAKINFWITITSFVFRIALIFAFVSDGLEVLLQSFVIWSLIRLLILQAIIWNIFNLDKKRFITILLKNIAIVLLSLIVPIYLWVSINALPSPLMMWTQLIGSGVVSFLIAAALVYQTKHPLSQEITHATQYAFKKFGWAKKE
tara:strand:+ start:2786 stop:4264 length:1479 start_codon:yes stop_codon:yes gene_type:complete